MQIKIRELMKTAKSVPLEIPVLFIVFRRLDTTKRVLDRIREAQPKRFYIAADGPRKNKPKEFEQVKKIREFILKNIDWDCEVHTKFSEKNLGCKYNPQSAISWFFEHEEMGIILEDDCVPSSSFFKYCEELLHKYQKDLRIWGISGTNLLPQVSIANSYYFSEFFMIWGWASWRDRWQKHLHMLEDFDTYLDDPLVYKKLNNNLANKQIIKRARISHQDKLDTWDYQWIFSCFANNALLITPTKNLIQNIGFGIGATHTGKTKGKQIEENEITFPLNHPRIIHANQTVDNIFFKQIFGWLTNIEKISSINFIKAYLKAKLNRLKSK